MVSKVKTRPWFFPRTVNLQTSLHQPLAAKGLTLEPRERLGLKLSFVKNVHDQPI